MTVAAFKFWFFQMRAPVAFWFFWDAGILLLQLEVQVTILVRFAPLAETLFFAARGQDP